MGTQQTPAPSVSATKHSSAPNSFLAQVQIAHLWVWWLGLGYCFCACVVDGSARDQVESSYVQKKFAGPGVINDLHTVRVLSRIF